METFSEIDPCHPLRPYQKDAVRALWRKLEEHGKVLLHAPTGSGKTRMAMSAVSFHMRQKGPTMVLWLAHTSELIEQAAESFSTAWKHHGDIGAAVIQWRGGGQSFAHGMTLERNTMLVAGLRMAVDNADSNSEILRIFRDKVSLIVFDEAHSSVAPTYRRLVESIVDNDKSRLLLGLSATPGRACPDEAKDLAAMYGSHKVGISPPGENPIRFLVEKEYLANAHFHCLNFGGAPVPPTTSSKEEYPKEVLEELGEMDNRNQVIIQAVNSLFDRGHRRVIAFTPSVESAERCANTMNSAGFHYAHSVHGKLSQETRRHILRNYRANLPQPQVIFNCRVLTTGVDLPQTSAVVIGKPTKSPILLQQMIGRALRGPKSKGNKDASIVLVVDDTFEDFSRLSDMFSHQWDNLWDPIFQ